MSRTVATKLGREIRVQLGWKIAARRNQLGLSQKALSEVLGVTSAMLTRIEQGESDPSAAVLIDLQAALGVSINSFFIDMPKLPKNRLPEIEHEMVDEVAQLLEIYDKIQNTEKRSRISALVRSLALSDDY